MATVEIDLLNPHYKPYYEQRRNEDGDLLPPADWHTPEPVYFLTLAPDVPFRFSVGVPADVTSASLREAGIRSPKELAELAWQAVEGAVTELGIGGKTAVGYGYFQRPDAE